MLAGALLVASIVIFVLLRLLPGDIAQSIAGMEATPERLAAIRERLGLNRPLWAQYFEWMGGVVQGDFGESALTRTSVASQLGKKLTITAPLALAATVLSVVLSVPLGVWAAVRARKIDGLALNAVGQLGIAVPSFLIGIALIATLSGHFELPSQGFPRQGWGDDFWRAARSLVLPSLALAAALTSVLLRFTRAAILDVLNQDYIRTARAKGLSRTRALFVHGLRNASIPVIAVLGVQIASLIAGVVVIESVFNLPGVGRMLIDDIGSRDFDKVQGTVLLMSAMVIAIGFVVDIVARLIDPRLRR